MSQEIERKFLVTGDYKSRAYEQSRIVQGYISSARGRTVRVRIRSGKGYLTIKGASNVVDVYIRYLRKKIDTGFNKKLLHTIRGAGYVLREEK